MKKRIGDLTLEEMKKYCKHWIVCEGCPLNKLNINCSEIQDIKDKYFDKKIEIEEDY